MHESFINNIFKLFGTDVPDDIVRVISEKYSAPNRYYHNMNHISDMMYIFGKILIGENVPENRMNQCRMAILFHDVIYETRWDDTKLTVEDASASLFMSIAQKISMNVDIDGLMYIDSLIRSTKEHVPVDSTIETLAFLDSDMAILSEPRVKYLEYASAVRREWEHVSDETYTKGRSSFLESLLESPVIYRTEAMKHREDLARDNIRAELTILLQ